MSFALLAFMLNAVTPVCSSATSAVAWQMPQGHIIAGTLLMPAKSDRAPVVLYIGGAGPSTRDYFTNSAAKLSVYRALQLRLLCHGVGSLTFDEVGTGKSTGTYALTATTSTLAADVRSIVSHLGNHRSVLPDRIFLVGHSEGAAIAAIAADGNADIAGIVMLAAPVHQGQRIMEDQWVAYGKGDERSLRAMQAEHARRLVSDRWYVDFLKFDPSAYYKRISAPLLILHGERDLNVDPFQADSILHLVRTQRDVDVHCVRFADTDHTFTDMEYKSWMPHARTLEAVLTFVIRLATRNHSDTRKSGKSYDSCVRAH